MQDGACVFCGGTSFINRNGVYVCAHCRAIKQEKVTNEEISNLRAAMSDLRVLRFDLARERFEDIIRHYPNNSDAYWGLLLCEYGIVYELDYNHEQVPTCHNTSYESLYESDRYKKAIALAPDEATRHYYEGEAKRIEDIRKDWVRIAQTEDPYDIFLSFKATEDQEGPDGERPDTPDRAEAHRLYEFLTKELHYRVFFSDVSLQGLEGKKYEPYIFNALNTAKALIVYASSRDYVNSGWVRNEWSRFYKRIRDGEKIPDSLLLIFRGFNPASLGKPFSDSQGLKVTDLDNPEFRQKLAAYLQRVIHAYGMSAIKHIDLTQTTFAEVAPTPKKKAPEPRIKKKAARHEQPAEPLPEVPTTELRSLNAVRAQKVNQDVTRLLGLAAQERKNGYFDDALQRYQGILKGHPNLPEAILGEILARYKVTTLTIPLTSLEDHDYETVLSLLESSIVDPDTMNAILDALIGEIKKGLDEKDPAKRADAVKRYYEPIMLYDLPAVASIREAVVKGLTDCSRLGKPQAEFFLKCLEVAYAADNAANKQKRLAAIEGALWYGVPGDGNDLLLDYYAARVGKNLKYYGYKLCHEFRDLGTEWPNGFPDIIAAVLSKGHFDAALFERIWNDVPNAETDDLFKACYDAGARALKGEIKVADESVKVLYETLVPYDYSKEPEEVANALEIFCGDAFDGARFAEAFEVLLDDHMEFKGAKPEEYLRRRANRLSGYGYEKEAPPVREKDLPAALELAQQYYERVNAMTPAKPTCMRELLALWCRKKGGVAGDFSDFIPQFGEFTTLVEPALRTEKDNPKAYLDLLHSRFLGPGLQNIRKNGSNTPQGTFDYIDHIMRYFPPDEVNSLVAFLEKLAALCLEKSLFSKAADYYGTLIGYDVDNYRYYWYLFCAKIHARNDDEVVRCPEPIGNNEDFKLALEVAAKDLEATQHLFDLRKANDRFLAEKAEREEQERRAEAERLRKKRKKRRTITISTILSVIVVGALAAGALYYFNFFRPAQIQQSATTAAKAGNYAEALQQLNQLGDANEEVKSLRLAVTSAVSISEGDYAAATDTMIEAGGTVNVDFDPRGGTVPSSKMVIRKKASDKITENVPEKAGYTFAGWKLSSGWECTFDPGELSLTMSMWASYDIDTYNITYDLRGGTLPVANPRVYTVENEFALKEPTKKGFTFLGWYDKDGKKYPSIPKGTTGDLALIAKWNDGDTYTVSLDPKGGIVQSLTAQVQYLQQYELETPTRKGYTFKGWWAEGHGVVANSGLWGFDDVTSLTANWEATEYRIVYDAGAGTNDSRNRVYYNVTDESFDLYDAIWNGRDFLGWYDQDGNKVTRIEQGSVGDLTLTARWSEPVLYTVTFMNNDATVLAIQKGYFGDEIAYPGETPVAANQDPHYSYTFAGWGATMITGNANLIAQYETTSLAKIAQFYDYDGNYLGNGTVYPGEEPVAGYTPYRQGDYQYQYEFDHWEKEQETASAISYQATYRSCTAGLTIEDGVVTAYTGSSTEVVIPDTWGGKPVTAIGDSAFKNMGSVTSVTLPDGLTSIGTEAFSHTAISSIQLPSSITSIGRCAFGYTSLTSIAIPDSITAIPAELCFCCESLASVTLPETTLSIGSLAFRGCKALSSIPFPATLEIICEGAFMDCAALTSLTFPDAFVSVGSRAFYLCNGLQSISFEGKKLIEIGSEAFRSTSISSLSLPEGIVSIGALAFADCEKLETVTVGKGPVGLPNNLFAGDTALKSVILPAGMTAIGSSAFPDQESLSVYVEETKDKVAWTYPFQKASIYYYSEKQPFAEGKYWHYVNNVPTVWVSPHSAENLAKLTFTDNGDDTYSVSAKTDAVGEVIIPSEYEGKPVTAIAPFGFANCGLLTSIIISDSIATIGESAFAGSSSLAGIEVAENNENFSSVDGVLFNKDKTQLITYPAARVGEYAVPETVTSLKDHAFAGAAKLTGVTLPSALEAIPAHAFENCTLLAAIELPESVKTLGAAAFAHCETLTSLEIPSGVTVIPESLCAGDYQLSSVTLPEGVNEIGDSAFWATALETIALPSTLTALGASAFSNCNSLVSITLPKSVTTITGNPFAGDYNLLSIGVEAGNETYESIDGSLYTADGKTMIAFASGKEGEAIVPEGVTAIGDYAFLSARSVTSIALPTSVQTVGTMAFADCYDLQSIDVPTGITSFGASAFVDCPALQTVVVLGTKAETKWESPFAESTIVYYYSETRPTDPGSYWHYVGDERVVWPSATSKENMDKLNGYRIDGGWTFSAKNQSISGTVVIPSEYEGYPVEAIGSFANCANLTEIVIPSTIKTIDDGAFAGCTGLTSFELDPANPYFQCIDGVLYSADGKTLVAYPAGREGSYEIKEGTASIAKNAFFGSKVESVAIPETVTALPEGCFDTCASLASVSLPSTLTSIGDSAFRACGSLAEISIPEGVASIGSWAFGGCTLLGSFTVPSTVTTLGMYAFAGCSSAESITLPESMTSLPEGLFSGCSSFTSIVLPSGVTQLPASIYKNCTSLVNFALPESIEVIGAFAFANCTGFTEVVIPLTVTAIGAGAFSGCRNIAEMSLPFVGTKGVTSTSASASSSTVFGAIFGSTSYDGGVKTAQYYSNTTSSYVYTYIPVSLRKVTVTGAYVVFYGAFSNCSYLTQITVEPAVTRLQNAVFRGCAGLTDLTVPYLGNSATQEYYGLFGGYFYTTSYTGGVAVTQSYKYTYGAVDMQDTITYYLPEKLATVTVTGGNSIFYHAFENCSMIKTLTLGAANLGNELTPGCTALASLTLSPTVTSVGQKAFYENATLASVSFSENLKSIGSFAFSGIAITELTIPDSVTTLGSYAFANNSKLSSVTFGTGLPSVPSYAFTGCRSLSSVSFGDCVTAIERNAFETCTSLTSITLPKVETLANYAFSNCDALESISMPAMKTIGQYTFQNCTGFTILVVPDSVTSIGTAAFVGCSHLQQLTLPFVGTSATANYGSSTVLGAIFGSSSSTSDTLVTQYYQADSSGSVASTTYRLPSSLQTVHITGSKLSVGAFSNIKSLTMIDLGTMLEAIPAHALRGCVGISQIAIPGSVTSIGRYAFYECTGLTEAILPEGIITLEAAFPGCTALRYVEVPSSVTSIASGTFSGCSALESMVLPFVGTSATAAGSGHVLGALFGSTSYSGGTQVQQSHTSGSSSAIFYIPSKLSSVTVTGDTLNYGAFCNCSMLTSVVLSDDTKEIPSFAFRGCTGLSNVSVGKKAVAVGNNAFWGCTALSSIVLPNTIESLGTEAFYNCSSLSSVALSSHLTAIPNYAFYGCSSLKSIVLPDFASTVGSYAFRGCVSLASVSFPEGMVSIGTQAFLNAPIVTLDLPTSITSIGSSAFSGDTALTSVTLPNSGATTIGDSAFLNCKSLSRLVIPDGVTAIGNDAFGACSGLVTVTLGSGLVANSIGTTAFSGCVSLVEIINRSSLSLTSGSTANGYVAYYARWILDGSESSKVEWGDDGFVIYSETAGDVWLIRYAGVSEEVVIPAKVTAINKYAFYQNETVRSVKLHDGVLTIGELAFSYCATLESVDLGHGLLNIAPSAFSHDASLVSIVIPNSVQTIDNYAFEQCTGLVNAFVGTGVTSFGLKVFAGCASLEDITLPYVAKTLELSENDTASISTLLGSFFSTSADEGMVAVTQKYNSGSSSTRYIPASLRHVTVLGGKVKYGAFYNCNMLTSITFGDGVTMLGDYACYDASKLEEVVVGNGVTSIGSCAFAGCRDLADITLGSSLQVLSDHVFYEAAATSIVLPASLTSIGAYAFAQMPNLESVVFNNGLTSIGDYAFYTCPKLGNVEFPASLQAIGSYAFSGCTSLKEVVIPDQVIGIGTFAFYNDTGLHGVTIGAAVTEIRDSAFNGCTHLGEVINRSSLNIVAGATTYGYVAYYAKHVGGSTATSTLFTDDLGFVSVTDASGEVYLIDYEGDATEIVIPDRIDHINDNALRNNTSITKVTIHEGIKTIGARAFAYCTALKEVHLGCVTRIATSVFLSTAITSIVLPETLQEIGTNALNATTLKTVYIEAASADDVAWSYSFPSTVTEYYLSTVQNLDDGYYWHYVDDVATAWPRAQDAENLAKLSFTESTASCSVRAANTSISGTVLIPESHNGKPVLSLPGGAFADCANLTAVYIPSSVTSIGASAFTGCSSLELMSIPFVGSSASPTTSTDRTLFGYLFGQNAFDGATATTQNSATATAVFYIPDSLHEVIVLGGKLLRGAFNNCANLRKVTLLNGVTEMGTYIFDGCTWLTTVSLGYGIDAVGGFAFKDCTALKDVFINGDITSIGMKAFLNCTALESIYVPYTCESIGESAFQGCTALTKIQLGSGLRTIYASAFADCVALETFYIPMGVTSIGTDAFSGCTALTTVLSTGTRPETKWSYTFAEGITKYYYSETEPTDDYHYYHYVDGKLTFWPYSFDPENMAKMEFVDKGDYFEVRASSASIEGSVVIPSAYQDKPVLSIAMGGFNACFSLTEVVIPEGITTIGEGAFASCTSLTSLAIPSTVTTIGDAAFASDTLLSSITVASGSTSFKTVDGVLYSYDGTTLVAYPATKAGHYIVPNGTTAIASGAFAGSLGITGITIPNGVTSIGSHAFNACANLKDVVIADSVSSIGEYAFEYCTSLISLALPASLSSVAASAFYGCSALTSVILPAGLLAIGANAFAGCTALTSVFDKAAEGEAQYIYDFGANVTVYHYGEEKPLGWSTYWHYVDGVPTPWPAVDVEANLAKLSFEENPSQSGTYLAKAANLAISGDVLIPETYQGKPVVGVAFRGFRDCDNLERVYVPDSVTAIDLYAFRESTSLRTVRLPSGLTEVAEGMFYGCISLDTIAIPSGVASIGGGAFYNCRSLNRIVLPAGLNEIGNQAFVYCYTLVEVVNLSSLELVKGDSGFGSVARYAKLLSATLTATKLQVDSDGYVIYTDGEDVDLVGRRGSYVEVVVPSGVKTIHENAFYGRDHLFSVLLPSSVTGIGERAFYLCDRLVEVVNQSSLSLTIGTSSNGYVAYRARHIIANPAESSLSIDSNGFVLYTAGLEVRVVDYFGEGGNVVLPSNVTAINDYAFRYNENIDSITLPEGVTTIGQYAFYSSRIKSISLSGGLATIDKYAFGYGSLTSVALPGGVTEIGEGAFYNCGGLVTLTLSNTLESIGKRAFENCTKLSAIVLPNSLQSIGDQAFVNCYGITSVTVPDSVTTIGKQAFAGMANLVSANIGSGVTSMGDELFQSCAKLVSLTVPYIGGEKDDTTASKKTLLGNFFGTSTFTDAVAVDQYYNINASSKTTFYFPSTLRMVTVRSGEIGYGAFQNLGFLEGVNLLQGVTAIGTRSFSMCVGLTSFSIPSSVESLGGTAFYGCGGLTAIAVPDSVTSLGYYAFQNCTGLLSATIGEGITALPPYTFSGCTHLESVTLGSKIASIGNQAFHGCVKLESISLPAGLTSIGEYAFHQAGLTAIVVPDSVQSIGQYAFDGNSLVTATIGRGVSSLGASAFMNCTALTEVVFLGDQLTALPGRVFQGCTSLASVTLPETIASIGGHAFCNDQALTSLYLPRALESIDSHAFDYCKHLETVLLPSSLTSIGEDAFVDCDALATVFVENAEGEQGWSYAFPSGAKLYYYSASDPLSVSAKYWHYVNGVPTIWPPLDPSESLDKLTFTLDGSGDFYSVKAKSSSIEGRIIIPETYEGKPVTTLPNSAFQYCDGITVVILPDSIVSLGTNAFYDCGGLTMALLGNGITEIPQYAFYGCEELTSFTVPDSVETIGASAFSNCAHLRHLVLGSAVTSIASGSFNGCDRLVEVANRSSLVLVAGTSSEGYVAYNALRIVTSPTDTGLSQDKDGFVFLQAGENRYLVDYVGTSTRVAIPAGTVAIAQNAFKNCERILSVTLPSSLVEIGDSSFTGCRRLVEVVNDSGFSIAKGSSLNGGVAFYAKGVISGSDPSRISVDTAGNALYDDGTDVWYVGYYGTSGDVAIPGNVTKINDYAFYSENVATNVTMGNAVTGIGEGAFMFARSLVSASLGNGISAIPYRAFYYASSLDTVVFPNALETIAEQAFSGCSALLSVHLPNSVTTLGTQAFSSCGKLDSFLIGQGVNSIGTNCFQYCSALKTVMVFSLSSASLYSFSTSTTTIYIYDTENHDDAYSYWHYVDGIPTPFPSAYTPENMAKLSFSSNTAALTGTYGVSAKSTSISGDVRIPMYYNNALVKTVKASGFQNCSAMTSIHIPEGIQSIGNGAFYGCTSLADINLPSTITVIDQNAFYNCSALESLELPSGLTALNSNVFFGCSALSSVELPDGLQYLYQNCFQGSGVETVEIPSSVTFVGQYAFKSCPNLSSVVFRGSLDALLSYTFYDCPSLAVIVLPKDLVTIQQYAFQNATGLQSITLPETVETIAKNAFQGCSSLTSVTINEGVTSLGANAFEDCTSLQSIVLPSSITSMGESVFKGCTSLQAAILPTGIATIPAYTFQNCTGLENYVVHDSLRNIGNYAFSGCTSLKWIVLPDSVGYISSSSFNGCTGLETVFASAEPRWPDYFSSSVEKVYYNAYGSIGSDVSYWRYVDGVPTKWPAFDEEANLAKLAFTLEGANYTVAAASKDIEGIVSIPAYYEGKQVRKIAESGFADCSHLIAVYAPAMVSSIGTSSFARCTSLRSVQLPCSTYVFSIPDYSFAGCSSLVSFTFPKHLGSVGEYAFQGCVSLRQVTLLESSAATPTIADTAFSSDCPNIIEVLNQSSLVITKGSTDNGSIALHAKNVSTNSSKVSWLPDGSILYRDGDERIYIGYAGTNHNVEIPEGVTKIAAGAFTNCQWLLSIKLPSTLSSIEDGAFVKCFYLAEIINGSSLDIKKGWSTHGIAIYAISIVDGNGDSKIVVADDGSYAKLVGSSGDILIRYYGGGTGFVIPEGIAGIGVRAFMDCASLSSVVIPEGVTSIGQYAFAGCTSLTSVIIPQGVTSIGISVFHGCTSLSSVDIPSSVTSIGTNAFFNCVSLTSVAIPEGVTSIGALAFTGCESITSVIIPQSVTSILWGAFDGFPGLTVYALAANPVPGWSSDAFDDTATVYYFSEGEPVDFLPRWHYVDETPTVWPEATVEDNLSKLHFGYISAEDAYSVMSADKDISGRVFIPSTFNGKPVIRISGNAFSNCASMTAIYIPDGVTRIDGSYAFASCTSLVTVILPDTLEYMGPSTFNNCSALRSISIPAVGTVYNYGFSGCSSLKTVIVAEGVTVIEYCNFLDVAPETIVLPKSLTSVDAFYGTDTSNLKLYLLAASPSEVLWTDGPSANAVPRLYYSETKPTDTTYSYWHYANGIPVAW